MPAHQPGHLAISIRRGWPPGFPSVTRRAGGRESSYGARVVSSDRAQRRFVPARSARHIRVRCESWNRWSRSLTPPSHLGRANHASRRGRSIISRLTDPFISKPVGSGAACPLPLLLSDSSVARRSSLSHQAPASAILANHPRDDGRTRGCCPDSPHELTAVRSHETNEAFL